MNVFRRTAGLLTLAVVLSLGAAGCAKKAPLPAPPAPPPPPTAPAAAADATTAASAATSAARARGAQRRRDLRRKTLDQLNAERPLGDVYFDLDESTVRDDARGTAAEERRVDEAVDARPASASKGTATSADRPNTTWRSATAAAARSRRIW